MRITRGTAQRWAKILTRGRPEVQRLKYYFRRVQSLTIWDLVLTPIYLAILILIAKSYRDRKYPHGHPLRPYYLPGLYAKFGGAIFIALVYQFYYGGGGDSFNYHNHSVIINSSLDDSFGTWFDLILRRPVDTNPKLYAYASQMEWYIDPASYPIASLGAVFGLLNGTTYIPIALLFAFFSYTGIWAMYITFAKLYPKMQKPLAFAFLFIPSTIVWGSGMYKDTVCMFGLGWMIYTSFRIFLHRDFSVGNLLLMAISFYLIAVIKIYILLSFLPALSLWILLNYSHRIHSSGVRFLVRTVFVGVAVAGFFYISQVFAKELNKYSLEKIAQTSTVTRDWIAYASGDEGSAYDLGDFEPTVAGMLSKFPAAVVVTLFRPFLWEVNKVIVGLSAIEAALFLGLTLYIIFKGGPLRFVRKVVSDPNLTFFFVFSVIFAFAVGISSYNFGALSRYKIPCLPFYGALLMIMFYSVRDKNTSQAAALRKAPPVYSHT